MLTGFKVSAPLNLKLEYQKLTSLPTISVAKGVQDKGY